MSFIYTRKGSQRGQYIRGRAWRIDYTRVTGARGFTPVSYTRVKVAAGQIPEGRRTRAVTTEIEKGTEQKQTGTTLGVSSESLHEANTI